MLSNVLWRALKYWEAKKLALDAVRPDFTADQLRELNAADGRLLAAIHDLSSPSPPVADITVNDFVCAVGEMTNEDALQRVKELVRAEDARSTHD